MPAAAGLISARSAAIAGSIVCSEVAGERQRRVDLRRARGAGVRDREDDRGDRDVALDRQALVEADWALPVVVVSTLSYCRVAAFQRL